MAQVNGLPNQMVLFEGTLEEGAGISRWLQDAEDYRDRSVRAWEIVKKHPSDERGRRSILLPAAMVAEAAAENKCVRQYAGMRGFHIES